MKHDATDIATLILKEISGQITREQSLVLEEWKNASEANLREYAKLKDLSSLQEDLKLYREAQVIGQQLKVPQLSTVKAEMPGKVIPGWTWIAASVTMLLGIGIYFYKTLDKPPAIATRAPRDIAAPASSKAMITLGEGSLVYLDSVGNGQLAKVGNIKLVKLAGGQIAYQTTDGQISKELQYNTLTNPKGSRVIDMQLSDGSHIWLNAGSSIRYPVAFVGNERKVELNGEGYFEITHDEGKPFYVSKGAVEVKVLGTHFNVNAYEDENDVKVTLIEGKVQVNAGLGREVKLSPGQQAVATGTNLSLNPKVDMDAVMSWKNNIFDFNHVDLATVLRQIARWYDLDIVYEGKVPTIRFVGKIQRDLNLSEVLEGLKQTGVDFRIEGKRLIVLN